MNISKDRRCLPASIIMPLCLAMVPYMGHAQSPDLEKLQQTLALPTVDSLGENSDYGIFMAPEVPAATRRLALRRLWSDARFSGIEPLFSYGLNYTLQPAGAEPTDQSAMLPD